MNTSLRKLVLPCTVPVLLLIMLATSLAWPRAADSPASAARSASNSSRLWTKVGVELPSSEIPFPPGKGSEMTPQCLICHSADMVLHQPPLTQGEWVGEINKMRNAFGAPLPANQVEELARYLYNIQHSDG
jgi:hypothetical protein